MTINAVPNVPYFDAEVVGDIKTSGRSEPIAMRCRSLTSDELADFVVKTYANQDLVQRSLARELFGSLLGQVFGFSIPDAAIINIDPNLHLAITDEYIKNKLFRSPGLNFGSKLISPGFFEYQYIPQDLQQKALDIFSFDLLIWNVDRRIAKPNLVQVPSDFILFDHEQAFVFASPGMFVGGVPEPWNVKNEPWIGNHVFFQDLKKLGNSLDIDYFFTKLIQISDDILDTIVMQVPIEWQSEEIEHIVAHIQYARDSVDLMVRCVQEILA